MSFETSSVAGKHVLGMPDELADAIYRVLDETGRERALATWSSLHEYDRRLCRNYVDGRDWARWRRRRCEKAAHKLSVGGPPPRRLRLPRWIRVVLDIVAGAA